MYTRANAFISALGLTCSTTPRASAARDPLPQPGALPSAHSLPITPLHGTEPGKDIRWRAHTHAHTHKHTLTHYVQGTLCYRRLPLRPGNGGMFFMGHKTRHQNRGQVCKEAALEPDDPASLLTNHAHSSQATPTPHRLLCVISQKTALRSVWYKYQRPPAQWRCKSSSFGKDVVFQDVRIKPTLWLVVESTLRPFLCFSHWTVSEARGKTKCGSDDQRLRPEVKKS